MTAAPTDFRALYVAELGYVVGTLRRLGVASADLEDVAHDVFATAYRRREDRDPDRPVRPWLFGIAYRVVGNYRQKAHRTREVAVASEPRDGAPSPVEQVELRERVDQLQAALAALDLDHRAAVVLHDLDRLPAPVIADVLGIPLNTVYSRVRAARLKLLELTRSFRGGS